MNINSNERKVRFKMYKSGKQWIVAGLTTAVISIAVYGGSSIANGGIEAKADAQNAATSSIVNTNNSTNSSNANSIASLPQNGTYSTNDNGQTWKYVAQNKDIQGLYKDNNDQLRYFNEYDGTQAKGDIVNVNNDNYYFDKDSGQGHKIDNYTGGSYSESKVNNQDGWIYKSSDNNDVKGVATVDGNIQYFDQNTGLQLKGGAAQIGGVDYYFEPNKGNLVGKVDQVVNSNDYSDNKLLDSNKNVVKGLVVNNGQLQYFDTSNGNQAKDKQVIANGVTYYFDTNGNGQYLFTNTGKIAVNDFTQRNAANSVNPSDYKNLVDGFFTADTWYRPKQILDNGTNWRNSNSNELRPMITAWWPNKDVQVNYLKLMQNNGLLDKSNSYTVQSDQQTLNQAAQKAQVNIEKKISQTGNTDWLNDLLFSGDINHPSFVNQQYVWNILSESPGQDDALLQNGYFKYVNSELTPNTNSSYRISNNLCDFLLANDVDNSNPAVQAEDLNWLYYLTNFGTITANDPNANFDSIRIDAYAFINNDIVQRSNDYMRQKYKLTESSNNANSHLSIVEAGVDAGTTSTNNDELVESPFRTISYGLIHKDRNPQDMNNFIKEVDTGVVIADHENNSQEIGQPNYSIVHAHDKDIQDKVGEAIVDATGIKDWTNFTPSELSAGLKLYYDDQRSSEKKYNDYNIPSAYAIMLTNKGTVPRIYYGDMYQDDGQFMQKQSIYYDDIVSLLTARKKYVSGGQSMSVDHNNFLESVRFGKGAGSESDSGNAETRNEGIGLIVGNDQNKKLNDGDTVVLHMGAAHRNQKYRALMLTTNDGIKNYDSDENAPIAETDSNGDLVFSNKDINGQANTSVRGVLNPEVAGYVAAWVPLGASDDQDSRTLSSNKSYNDGKVLHSGDDLDSNVMFEAFSNFQPEPTNENEYENVVIPQKASLFKDWGITSFELPPQYRSSNDHTFVDSTINNGYAFSDRYDMGFGQPTKYGTDVDLRNTIKSLHDNGMQVMADVVYNQLYNLTGQEVVSAVRAGFTGNTVSLPFGNQLYVVNTVGGGDYQKKYGGAFLQKLYQEYPSLFDSEKYQYNSKNYDTNLLVMTDGERSSIPSDQPITQWSAKYMNGTNILGRGMGYVLKDWNTGAYFKISGNDSTLPESLTYRSGWVENPDSSWSYYANNSFDKLTGAQIVNDQRVFFDNNGIQVKGGWVENSNGTYSYYDKNSGNILTGDQLIDGEHFFFDNNGVQVKGKWIKNSDGSKSYYDSHLGKLIKTDKKVSSNARKKKSKEELLYENALKVLRKDKKRLDKNKTKANIRKYNKSLKKYRKAKKKLLAIAKNRVANARKAIKIAKKVLSNRKNINNEKRYYKALKEYYVAEKSYLKITGNYNKKYYYEFDQLTPKVKVVKNIYSYKSRHFTKKNRVKKIKKGTLVRVKSIVRSGKVARINIGNGHFITSSKDFIKMFK